MDTGSLSSQPDVLELPVSRLVVIYEGGVEVVGLDSDRDYVVGRDETADITIPDPSLSRRHAELRWDSHRLTVRDLGSRHGTRRNGEPLETASVTLEVGDELRLGHVRVLVHGLVSAGVRRLMSDTALWARVDEELARARISGRSGAVALLRGPYEVLATIPDELALYEHAAWVAEDELLLTCPELPEPATRARLEKWGSGPVSLAWTQLPCPAQSSAVLHDHLRAALTPLGPGQTAQVTWGRQLREVALAVDGVSRVVARSRAFMRVLEQARRLAASELPIVVLGPTGAGKELVAELIHAWSSRRERPFIALSCATLTSSLVMAELFGYEARAFTGASEDSRAGILESAHTGTVFLDEVGELSREAQAALLRALETKRIRRVGGTREIAADVRVIAATCAPLRERIADGSFREDLFYRLAGDLVQIPPLRERPEDTRALAEAFVRQFGQGRVTGISQAAMTVLLDQPWPGNVRELRQVIQRGVAWSSSASIEVDDLPDTLRGEAVVRESAPAAPLPPGRTLPEQLKALRRQLIVQALDEAKGHRETAARKLGIPRRTLAHHIHELGLVETPE